jgi:hypothetical protein
VKPKERAELLSQIAEAIRTLKLLDSVETCPQRETLDRAVHDAQQAYLALLAAMRLITIPPDDMDNVQYFVDRLRMKLRSFGELD